MDKAINWLEQLRAERNHVVQMWQAVGITAEHAADSQALLQLKWQYCDRHDCLRCRFGTRYLQQRKIAFLKLSSEERHHFQQLPHKH